MTKGNPAAWTMGLALMACAAGSAHGDGCMFAVKEVGQSQKMVTSHRQEALLATDGQTVRVTLRTHFRAGPSELAWIVPVPARPDSVEPADDAVFADLERATAPKFYRVEHRGGGFGCGCGGGNFDPVVATPEATVTVEASGTAGIFKYEVLAAKDSDDLVAWLRTNGYAVPLRAQAVFGPYVKARWHWLAMRVRPEATQQKNLAPHPVAYTYRSATLTYPLAISELSADAECEVLLYVLGPSRYACANWSNTTSQQLAGGGRFARDAASPSGTNYESLFRAASLNSQYRLFVTEFAGLGGALPADRLQRLAGGAPGPERATYLTRLRAVMPPVSMDRDVLLVPVAWENLSPVFHVASNQRRRFSAGVLAVAAGAMGLLCTGMFVPRRGRWGRGVAGACVATGCLILTMV